MTIQYYQNLDLDKINKEELKTIIEKIKKNPCCLSVNFKDSSTKGYHVSIICNKKCDICRFVFDDQKRYEIDLGRDEKFKNTTFTEKEYFRGNMKTLKHYCERCKTYGIPTQTLSKRDLTIDEVREKMKFGKIKNYPYQLVYLGYIYLECPICHWFKFVKKSELANMEIKKHDDKIIDV
jgi:hypothetical protein